MTELFGRRGDLISGGPLYTLDAYHMLAIMRLFDQVHHCTFNVFASAHLECVQYFQQLSCLMADATVIYRFVKH